MGNSSSGDDSSDKGDFGEQLARLLTNALRAAARRAFLDPVNVVTEKCDITSVKADVLINSTAEDFALSTAGSSKAIAAAGGVGIQQEIYEFIIKNSCPKPGEIIVTKAGQLSDRFSYIIHGACLKYVKGNKNTEQVMRRFIRNFLRKAKELECKNLAMPAIGTGILEFPPELMLTILFEELDEIQSIQLKKIKIVTLDQGTFQMLYRSIFLRAEHTSNDDFTCRTVDKSSDEYKEVVQRFSRTIGWKKHEVTMLRKVSNDVQKNQYNEIKRVVKERFQDKNLAGDFEKTLYHGTSIDVLPDICTNGFDRALAGKNADTFGKGTYFAVNSSYSAQDTYSTPDSSGHKYMLVCKVLTGQSVESKSDMITTPLIPGSSAVHYDSAYVKDNGNIVFYLTFKDNRAIPLYFIQFKML